MSKPKSVDSYIENTHPDAREHLKALRALVHKALPDAIEEIKWNVPFYTLNGPVCGVSAFNDHISFGPWMDVIESGVQQKLEKKGYTVLKRTIQIRYDQKIPAAEITQIVKMIAKINKAKKASKK